MLVRQLCTGNIPGTDNSWTGAWYFSESLEHDARCSLGKIYQIIRQMHQILQRLTEYG
jgi:hypothetical protein